MQTFQTSRFGPIQVNQSNIFSFPEGVLGFYDLKQYALINHEQDDLFLYLQSLENEHVCFPMIENPNNKKGSFCIVTVPNDPTLMTANFKAPIELNFDTMTGAQVVKKDPDLTIRHPIFEHLAVNARQGIAPKSLFKTLNNLELISI